MLYFNSQLKLPLNSQNGLKDFWRLFGWKHTWDCSDNHCYNTIQTYSKALSYHNRKSTEARENRNAFLHKGVLLFNSTVFELNLISLSWLCLLSFPSNTASKSLLPLFTFPTPFCVASFSVFFVVVFFLSFSCSLLIINNAAPLWWG